MNKAPPEYLAVPFLNTLPVINVLLDLYKYKQPPSLLAEHLVNELLPVMLTSFTMYRMTQPPCLSAEHLVNELLPVMLTSVTLNIYTNQRPKHTSETLKT